MSLLEGFFKPFGVKKGGPICKAEKGFVESWVTCALHSDMNNYLGCCFSLAWNYY